MNDQVNIAPEEYTLNASMGPDSPGDDLRLHALRQWLEGELGLSVQRLEPASSDASFRRYFRVIHAGGVHVAMDAPPETEDCNPFLHVAGLLHDAGVHVPDIVSVAPDQGFLLLEDLGRHTYLDVLAEDNADALFALAIDALIRFQAASRPGVLPEYDSVLLRRELELFPEWYLGRHLGLTLKESERQWLTAQFDLLVNRALAQPQVWVHRDYMPRNLMISNPMPGVLDFQDAVYGPVSYDITCLFHDAFISWPPERVEHWLRLYWERARSAGIPVASEVEHFLRDCVWMGVQRHLKVLGIFARIRYRDGKARYLQDAPRFLAYLEQAAVADPDLRELVDGIHAWHRAEGETVYP